VGRGWIICGMKLRECLSLLSHVYAESTQTSEPLWISVLLSLVEK
jgi:hypothetical protein